MILDAIPQKQKSVELTKTPKEIEAKIKEDLFKFLKGSKVYDILPMNGHILMLNSKLTLVDAMSALSEQEVDTAAIYNSEKQINCGIITLYDIMRILTIVCFHLIELKDMSRLKDEASITSFIKEIVKAPKSINFLPMPPVNVEIENKLFDVIGLLTVMDFIDYLKIVCENAPLEVALLDEDLVTLIMKIRKQSTNHILAAESSTDQAYSIISYDTIISHIINKFEGEEQLYDIAVSNLAIGNQKVISIKDTECVLNAFITMLNYNISFLSIVNKDGKTVGVFTVYDILGMIRNGSIHKVQ